MIQASAMPVIRLISASTIQAPSQADSDQKIHLTPWDLVALPIKMNQKGLLFHHKPSSSQFQHLRHSLSSTLAFFPLLAGRLIATEGENNTTYCHILCNNKGSLFVHAIAENTSVDDILQPKYVPSIVNSFFPLNGVRNCEGTSQPLLAVQVTELVDGVFIGFTINHVVADGESLWQFINLWSEISCGCHKLTKDPSLERFFLDTVEPPFPIPAPSPFTKEENQNSQNSTPETPVRVFHYTKEKIAQLKAKANAEAKTENISSLQALLTHFWISVIRCSFVDAQEEVFIFLPIGVRRRIVPPLPENYFGNALQIGVVRMKAGELLQSGIGKGAMEMNKMVASHCDEKVRSQYVFMAKKPVLLQLGGAVGAKALATGSSPRFNVYGNDFGWGKPLAVRAGSNIGEGMVALFGGKEKGSVDVQVCLPYEILEAMESDSEFIDAL
ncbi:hypothetical protein HN51_001009 [Arachis hypogaea]|uniref:Acetyltransferase n=2 Tax=Arachis hypogaea TaxID=3818 RepID=A0A445ETX5_ARAHY|nr:protein ENHANCED PSEUDOMONAS SUSCEPTIBILTY 1 [Arachis hypogaea]QHO49036.1 Anthranilate N-benzoyltransferase [Arachis hypogaea]RYR78777.1 hypothetical protein Ahy_A01g003639 isoform A [Arachis hypogaea]